LSETHPNLGKTLIDVETEMEDDDFTLTEVERRSDERRREDRRKEELGPPPASPNAARGANAGCLTGAFRARQPANCWLRSDVSPPKNMVFRQKGNKAAARRARKHLSQIMKLAKSRRAEISTEIKGLSPGDGAADDGDDAEE
jgi:hypothetical protein